LDKTGKDLMHFLQNIQRIDLTDTALFAASKRKSQIKSLRLQAFLEHRF
jgi:hypothetical protein